MALNRFSAIHSRCLNFTLLACLFHSLLLARDIVVPPGGDVQAAIDAAVPGDTITLTAGATYAGSYRLTYKVPTAAGDYITIRSSAFAVFQAGNRVSPADRTNMALVIAPVGLAAFQTERAANHYRLTGLEIIPTAGDYNYDLIRFGVGNESSSLDLPEYLQADHLYVHGDPAVGTKRGIGANGKWITIRDSYISGFFSTFQDSQAICGWNGPGPVTIVNNYLEAAGENIMFGGQTPGVAGLVPSDITIRGNYLYKPLSWKPTNYIIKNLLELKNSRRVLIEANILENSWGSLQFGQALTFTVRTEYGAAPWAVVEDVTFRYNIIRNAGRIGALTGFDDVPGQGLGSNLTLQNNVFENISERGFVVLGVVTLVIDHNTVLLNPGSQMLLGADLAPSSGLVFTNNIATHGLYGVWGSGAGLGTTALNAYFPGARFTNNVLLDPQANPASYPAGNLFRTTAEVGFMNLAAGDYRLGATSSFLASGTDGRALGADVATLMSMTANTVSGRTAAPASYQLTASATSILAGASLSVTWSASGAAAADRIGLFLLGGSSSSPVWLSSPTNGAVGGSFTLPAPSTPGQYEFRYLPGGGSTSAAASGPITVTEPVAPFTVTASPTVMSGQDTSVSWTAPVSRTRKDWIALFAVGAPASAYLAGYYTGGLATGSFTFTMALAPGQYEFRYLLNDTFSVAGRSPAISVTAAPVQTIPVNNIVVTAPNGTISPGAAISVRWTASGTLSSRDWIALYPVGAPDAGYTWGTYTRGAASGTFNLTAPTTPGQYEFRYLLNDGFAIGARSAAMAVAAPTVAAGISITAPTAAAPGSPLAINWTAPANHSSRDWIALYPAGGANGSFIWGAYVGTAANGTITLVAPVTPGQYEFRYLLNDSYSVGGTSSLISISAATASGFTIAASAASVNRGGTIQVQWTAPANRTTTDWVALYRTGAAPTAYLWGYYTRGQSSGTVQVTLPSTPGQYEFRYLPHDGLVPAAVSRPFTIQ